MKTTAEQFEDQLNFETDQASVDNTNTRRNVSTSETVTKTVSQINKVTVEIHGTKMTLTTDEDPQEVLRVADFLNSHIDEIKGNSKVVSTSDLFLRAAFVMSAKALQSTEQLESIERRSAEKLKIIEELLDERTG